MAQGNPRLMRAIELLFDQSIGNDSFADVASNAEGGKPSAAWYNFNTAQSITANTWTDLDWSVPSILSNRIADDMPDGFVKDSRLVAPNGHWYLMRVDIKFSVDDATCNILRFGLNDPNPGGFGVFVQPSQATLLGAGVADEATYQVMTFGDPSIPGGPVPQVFADGPVSITATQGFFARLGKFE